MERDLFRASVELLHEHVDRGSGNVALIATRRGVVHQQAWLLAIKQYRLADHKVAQQIENDDRSQATAFVHHKVVLVARQHPGRCRLLLTCALGRNTTAPQGSQLGATPSTDATLLVKQGQISAMASLEEVAMIDEERVLDRHTSALLVLDVATFDMTQEEHVRIVGAS